MRPLLLPMILSLVVACGDDDVANAPDAGGSDAAIPTTVWEHLVADGDWVFAFRARDLGCAGCRSVIRLELVPDEECGCVRVTVHNYWDVVATDDAMGLTDGDELCQQVFEMDELPVDGVDPAVRSVVQGTLTQSTCGDSPGGQLNLLLDAQQVDAAGRPGLIAMLQPGPANPYFHVDGYPTDPDDLGNAAVPLARCADADRAAGRDYCLPACDWPGADPGRTACTFPDYADPPIYDLGCQADPAPITAADPVTATGGINNYPQAASIAGAIVELRRTSDDVVLDTATTNASGAFSVTAATGGVPLEAYYHVTATGYLDGFAQHAEVLVGDHAAFATLYTPAVSEAFLAQVGAVADPALGTMVILALDCAGNPVPGATITITPAPAGLAYLDVDSAPDLDRTATSRSGFAVAWGVPVGPSTVTLQLGGASYRARPAAPVGANAVTSVSRAP